MRALKIFLLALAFVAFQAHAAQRNLAVTKSGAQAQKRVALVIGNAAYKDASPLRNPVNDAKAMSNALNGLGFEVIEVTNATQKEMLRAVTSFGSKLNAETVALFFYAGHGMQVRGKNYIIPVDAQIETEAAVASESVGVDTVLEQLNDSPVSIVILDACRNNPFERSFRKIGGGGLAQMDAPKGSFIAYATAPGKTATDGDGKNGLFTQELLKQINTTGLSLEGVFKRVRTNVSKATGDAQMPWDSSSMTGEFYFKPGDGTQVASLVPVPTPAGGGILLGDIKKQQEGRGQWDKWQQAMKADYDKIVALNAEADLQFTAWERFLTSYTQDNPYSAEDETLRAQAQQQQAEANLQQQKQEAERQRRQAEASRPMTNNTAQQAEEAQKDYIYQSEGYVYQGGLTWMPVTGEWKHWAEANSYCANTTIRGQSGWRLPTKDELSALYASGAIASGAMKRHGWNLGTTWSSKHSGSFFNSIVDLSDGAVYNFPAFRHHVTCVR